MSDVFPHNYLSIVGFIYKDRIDKVTRMNGRMTGRFCQLFEVEYDWRIYALHEKK